MIEWMSRHPVAANLLLILVLFGGGLSFTGVNQEVFPEFTLDIINVTVPYPGAAPSEVERSIIIPIENALEGIAGIKTVDGFAYENAGRVQIELDPGEDVFQLLDEVKTQIDQITIFPQDAEQAVVQTMTRKRGVIDVVLYGDVPLEALQDWATTTKNTLLNDPGITQVTINDPKAHEIRIEISQNVLRHYGLTLSQLSGIISKASLNLPGGSLKTSGGEILIRTQEQRYLAREYEQIPVFSTPTGKILLGDIAKIQDTFAETDATLHYNGMPSQTLSIFRIGSQTPKEISVAVRKILVDLNEQMPSSLRIVPLNDRSLILQQRIDLLMKSMWSGLILVIVVLALFLDIHLSFWIMLGIPTSFIGVFIFMPVANVTINMISLFAFILVLGIVVDDAIVIGENIHAHRLMGKDRMQAAIDGTREIAVPVLITILTTAAAFLPMFMIPGTMGKIFMVIPLIVIPILFISLVEVMYILPSHLSHKTGGLLHVLLYPLEKLFEMPRRFFTRAMEKVSQIAYRKTLNLALSYRYTSFALGVVFIMLSIGVVSGGHLKFTFFPKIDADWVSLSAQMPFGTPIRVTQKLEADMVQTAQEIIKELDAKAGHPTSKGIRSDFGVGGSEKVRVRVYLQPLGIRDFKAAEFSRRWKKRIGAIPGLERMVVRSSIGPRSGQADINLQLIHSDPVKLQAAIAQSKQVLSEYAGVNNIEDSVSEGKQELQITLNPEGKSMGLDVQNLSLQVRAAFQGLTVSKMFRGNDEVKVALRLPLAERRYLNDLENLVVRLPKGNYVPLGQVANIRYGQSYSQIHRIDGKRVVRVTANVDEDVSNASEVLIALKKDFLPQLSQQFPALIHSFEGNTRENSKVMQSLFKWGAAALLLIYLLLALQFGSYFQPIVIMTAIPFGMVGAVIGHLIMGYSLSLISALGVVALTGIVVNDSLILVDFINRKRELTHQLKEAVLEAGERRFRPIMLTTFTTFFGLVPIMFEQSLQARFLIPMAISLAFGVMFATLITLILIPVLYMILEDFLVLWGRFFTSSPSESSAPSGTLAKQFS